MYERYYKLSARPFQLYPDYRFFYGSEGHRRALAYLQYGIEQGEGFIVVTGEIGAGKTTLVETLLNQIKRRNLVANSLVTTQLDPTEMLALVAASFGLDYETKSKAVLLGDIAEYLKRKAWEDKRVLLIVDEVQNLSPATLEELRMLSNHHIAGVPLLQTFLIGQPDFLSTLQSPEMRQLRQRVIASYHLGGLREDEVRGYIEHRLKQVGWSGDPRFEDKAFQHIYEYTGGIPRNINKLCDRLLLFGSLEERHLIDPAVVRTVALEMESEIGAMDEPADETGETGAAGARIRPAGSALREKVDTLEQRVEKLEYALELECARLRALALDKKSAG